jgi:hypothetical protein
MELVSSLDRRSCKPNDVPGNLHHLISVGKELLQHRGQNNRNDIVRLTLQGAVLGIGKGIQRVFARLSASSPDCFRRFTISDQKKLLASCSSSYMLVQKSLAHLEGDPT